MNTETGVIRKQRSVAQFAPAGVSSVAAFSEAMAQRYASHTVTISGADLALAWESPAQVHHHHDASLWMLPAVTFEERNAFAAAPRELASPRSAVPRYGDAEASALFRRLFSRHARIAAFYAPAASAQPYAQTPERRLPEVASQGDAVERVLARARSIDQSTAAIDRAAPVPSTPPDPNWGTPLKSASSPKPVTLAAPEIRRVAEQVMREIDNRITARRERLGKH